jgi:hypothetical protein
MAESQGQVRRHPLLPLFSVIIFASREGPVKVGVADDREPDYTRFHPGACVGADECAFLDKLTVPAGSATDLTFHIDFCGCSESVPLVRLPIIAEQ